MSIGGIAQPEIIATLGGSISRGENSNENVFAEGRLMIGRQFRVGPYGNIIFSGGVDRTSEKSFVYRGRDATLGISIDNWGAGWRYNRYFWLNAGYRWSLDHGSNGRYESWQKNGGLAFSGGFRLNSLLEGWLGNHLVLIEYQTPLNNEVIAIYKGDTLDDSTPYNKARLAISYENGLKQFPIYLRMNEFRLEPLVSIGYIYEANDQRSFLEAGVGLSLGSMMNYYREWGKLIFFINQDLGSFKQGNLNIRPLSFGAKVVMNLNLKLTK